MIDENGDNYSELSVYMAAMKTVLTECKENKKALEFSEQVDFIKSMARERLGEDAVVRLEELQNQYQAYDRFGLKK